MKITLHEALRENGMVHFRVSCKPRPELNWERTCHNGILLKSASCPEWNVDSDSFYVWGSDACMDDRAIAATESDYARIQAAVSESNAIDGHVEQPVPSVEERIVELEKRVAALETADDPMQDDAGNGVPPDVVIGECCEPQPPEPEPKRWWANCYDFTAYLHNDEQEADKNNNMVSRGVRKVFVEAEAYDRIKAERDELADFVGYLAAGNGSIWGGKKHVFRNVDSEMWPEYYIRLAKHCRKLADEAAGRRKDTSDENS